MRRSSKTFGGCEWTDEALSERSLSSASPTKVRIFNREEAIRAGGTGLDVGRRGGFLIG